MAHPATRLLRAMIGRRARHPGRKRERRLRGGTAQETNRFIDRRDAFLRPHRDSAGPDEEIAVETGRAIPQGSWRIERDFGGRGSSRGQSRSPDAPSTIGGRGLANNKVQAATRRERVRKAKDVALWKL